MAGINPDRNGNKGEGDYDSGSSSTSIPGGSTGTSTTGGTRSGGGISKPRGKKSTVGGLGAEAVGGGNLTDAQRGGYRELFSGPSMGAFFGALEGVGGADIPGTLKYQSGHAPGSPLNPNPPTVAPFMDSPGGPANFVSLVSPSAGSRGYGMGGAFSPTAQYMGMLMQRRQQYLSSLYMPFLGGTF